MTIGSCSKVDQQSQIHETLRIPRVPPYKVFYTGNSLFHTGEHFVPVSGYYPKVSFLSNVPIPGTTHSDIWNNHGKNQSLALSYTSATHLQHVNA